MRTRLALLLGICTALQAQDDPKDLLLRASQKAMDTVDRLPKYVCTLTIDRAEYKSDAVFPTHSCDNLAAEKKAGNLKRRLFATDRLRLDVAVGTSHEIFGTTNEMYSWVGDNRFDDRGLLDLVRQGAISTGTFSTLLVSVFGEDRASFSYNGDLTVDGRARAEFGFRIPLEKSNYLYLFGKDRSQQVRAPVEGTLLVDWKTFDLVRLTVRHALPPEADACETSQTLDYGRVSLGGSDFLLATEARLNILSHADEMENHMVFSACHEFRGQSTLTFEPPLEPSGSVSDKGAPVVPLFALPPGLPLKVAFIEPIDTAAAAAGDPIRAKLAAAIRARSNEVLVPQGAIVSCRIVKAERLYGQNKSFVLAVKLESVVVGGISQPVKAAPDSGARRFTKGTGRLTQRIDLGPLNTKEDRDSGVFEFPGAAPNYVIKSGMVSNWLTLGP
jgi:hypothetical protein